MTRCFLSRALWLVALASFALSGNPAFANETFWNYSGTSYWVYGSNWSEGVPTASGTAIIGGFATSRLISGDSGTYLELHVARATVGTLRIDGGHLIGQRTFLGSNAGSFGTATINSGTWSSTNSMLVGYSGTGVLNVNGGRVTSGNGYIGVNAGSSGTANVTSGTWNISSSLLVGASGTGVLNVDGGYLSSGNGAIGLTGQSSGIATVTSGTWSISGKLDVAYFGTGVLNVNGGYLSNEGGFIGYAAGKSGMATVTSGTWSNSAELDVGSGGTGVLNVDGGLVRVSGIVTTGSSTTGVGAITLSGSSGNRGVLQTSQIREGLGTGTLDFNGGILQAGANHNDFLSGFEAGDVTIGAGGAFIDSNGFAITIAAPLDGSGKLTKEGAGTLMLSGSNSYSGGTTVTTGTLAVGSGGSISHATADTVVGSSSGDDGSLALSDGVLRNQAGYLGNASGSFGTATVTSGTWSNSDDLTVGNSGTGVLNVNGGSVTNANGLIGFNAGSSGTATVSSGTWSNSSELIVGGSGLGVLDVNGGYVSSAIGRIGSKEGSSGVANVTSGTWSNLNDLIVGNSGTGVLNVNGGRVASANGFVGLIAGSSGTATVTSGTWSNSNELTVGNSGSGVLNISGGHVSDRTGFIGYGAGSSGMANVTSGTWSSSDALFVGRSGTGALNVNGGLVSVAGTITTGNNAAGVGSITLSGSSGNRGVLRANQIREAAGTGTLDFNGGILRAGANHSDFLSGFEAGDVTIGAAGAFIDSNGFAITIAAPVDGSGRLTKQGTGALTLSGSNSYSGGTTVSSGTLVAAHNNAVGSGVVNIDGGSFIIDDTVAITNDLVFTGAGNVVRELASGASVAGALSVRSDLGGENTSAALLSGTASSAANLVASFSSTAAATNDGIRESDVFTLSGVPVIAGSETDVFVLQLSMTGVDSGSYLGWLNGSNEWVNAVDGNTNGTVLFVSGAWNASYGLGTYGVDVANNTVWAVLNHNSEFAIIPEPGSCALLTMGALVFVIRRRRPGAC